MEKKSITFKKGTKNFLAAVMPNGEMLPYQMETKIHSVVGEITRVEIKCAALDERIVNDEVPVYTVIINADPEKIDTSKLIAKFKNFQLISSAD